MRKTWVSVVALSAVVLSGCAAFAPRADDDGVPDDAEFVDEALPAADPAFTAHFTDPLYEDPASEFAPFGSDEGWDMLYQWDERRDELTPQTTVADLIEGSGFAELISSAGFDFRDDIPEPGGLEDAATIVIGAGFTLLRLTGHIDVEGRRETLRALDLLIERYDAPPELMLQRDDLLSWDG